jgi:SAM-dependent methyltransferase
MRSLVTYHSRAIAMLRRIGTSPWVYDQTQTILGARIRDRHIAGSMPRICPSALVLDLGGGTGEVRRILPSCQYVCADLNKSLLQRCRRKYRDSACLRCDLQHVPVRADSVDVILCVAVSHHLSDGAFTRFVSECARILHNRGRMLFLDLVRSDSTMSRLLWKLDRGSHLRSEEEIIAFLETSISISCINHYRIIHSYVVCTGEPQKPRASDVPTQTLSNNLHTCSEPEIGRSTRSN